MGARQHACARRLRIEHRARAEDHIRAEAPRDLFHDADRAGHGHRDLEHRDAALADGLDHAHGLVGRLGAHDRHHPHLGDPSDHFRLGHVA